MTNIYKTIFPDGSIYIAAKKSPPGNASESLSWAQNHSNPQRPLVAAYLKSNGVASTKILHKNLDAEKAKELKAQYVEQALGKKLNVIY
ncbi:hypothetical protein BTO10_15730 [Vibrio chagasii]|uniref:Uncharacterized protein n=1 Tax=Vibrio chagasii TaxID=170679 RepID=A0A2S7VHB1_9VIBR|nr:hypothetical protein [Vibrio chagasii]PQJ61573.1 hypothetical protein BTO10_15730 [Vibrio chagasii]